MRKITTILFLFTTIGLKAQNLVPNGGFENYYDCSNSFYDISNAIGWKGFQTPDYFNVCINPSGGFQTDAPRNFFGYQNPYKGNAYAGILTYYAYDYREIIQTKLSQKLNYNIHYCVDFKISLGDTSLWSVNKIGTYFSNDTLNPEPYIPDGSGPPWSIFTYYIPQIESNTSLTDTNQWVSINGVLLATGNEEYIAIGNFRDDNGTDTVRVRNSGYQSSYYYIDEIYVEEVLNANAGNDAYFISGDSIQLGNNPTENATYTWFPTTGLSNPNAPNPKAAPALTTTYIVTKIQCSVITTDTVTLRQTGVGVNESEIVKRLTIFPNPATNFLNIEYELFIDNDLTINIYDFTGKLIKQIPLLEKKGQIRLNTDAFSNGIYLFNITSKNAVLSSEKIAISN